MPHVITESCTGCTVCKRKCPVNAISGDKKEQHTIDPMLCIDCGVCGKVCAFAAIFDENGQLTQRSKQDTWAKPTWDYPLCVECRICVLVCPTGAINLAYLSSQNQPIKSSYPLLLNPQSCIGCGFCEKDCPTEAITMLTPISIPVIG